MQCLAVDADADARHAARRGLLVAVFADALPQYVAAPAVSSGSQRCAPGVLPHEIMLVMVLALVVPPSTMASRSAMMCAARPSSTVVAVCAEVPFWHPFVGEFSTLKCRPVLLAVPYRAAYRPNFRAVGDGIGCPALQDVRLCASCGCRRTIVLPKFKQCA